jgi:hypothetical protein
MVINAREKVRDILGRAREAEADYKKNGAEKHRQQTEQMTQRQREIAGIFDRQAKEAVEKYPRLFKAIEGDTQGNELLERGFARADAAFGGVLKGADGNPVRLSPPELAALHAEIRNKAGGFDRAIHLLSQRNLRIKELEKKLKQYEDSEPGAGNGRNGKRAVQPSSDDQIMAGLLKYAGR